MNTNYLMMRELLKYYHPQKMGILSGEERELIKTTLHIDEMSILDLRNLRDFVCLFFMHTNGDDDRDKSSAISYCIDERICELGEEV